MKVSVAALFLLILISTTPALYGQSKIPESVNHSPTCCLKYHEKVLPRKLVVGYRKALNCYMPAIIFVTKKNREVCTNPNNKWVQEYIKDPNLPLLPPRNLAQVKSIRTK
ncbi:C-C motif chemokine 16 [Suricata suricatta]|uniref:C-C motif chemokine n=1 Tax=Suricata suricatta TaxID=37032 RepID=A0A673VC37_SURSU|nr:C-C motif chemokine 16 [Suricata suricatta]